jgi:hypothetical protein
MLGDIGLVAKLLSDVFGFVVEPTGYEQLSRDNKLKMLMRGINECLTKDDWVRGDLLFAEYRELRQQIGP